jgi:tetratricopeptide (TPR) repeat protein
MSIKQPFHALLFLFLLFLAACAGEDKTPKLSPVESRKIAVRDSLSGVISTLESKVDLLDTTFDKQEARKLLGAYQSYYNNNTKDSLGGMFLYKAARLAHAMRNYRQAINLFTNYHDGFPNNPNRADAALIIGIIYEQDLRDKKSAKDAYQRVVELHPNTQQAKDAQSLLMLVDMSNDEMIDWLREQNNQKQ